MDKQRIIGDVVSSLVAVFMALVALILSIRYLARPQGLVDWSVQLCGAATVSIIIFFLCWGHFQRVPKPTPKVSPLPEPSPAPGNASANSPGTQA